MARETGDAARAARQAPPVTRGALCLLPVLQFQIIPMIHRVRRIGPVGGVGKRLMAFEARDSTGAARVELGVACNAFVEIVLHLFQDPSMETRRGRVVPSLFVDLKLGRHRSREILLEVATGA